MKQKLKILFILILLLFIPVYFYYQQAVKPVNPLDKEQISFSIETGEDVRSISQRLYDEKLIRSSLVFFLKARLTEFGNKIQAGEFMLSPSMDMEEIAGELLHGTMDVKLTIPEGWRKEEIAMKITSQFNIPESEFLNKAREGYLFPDTYLIPKEATGSDIIKILNDNFNKKTKSFQNGNSALINISLEEAVIIASMIEREAKFPEDRLLIARVILNRLEIGMKLDIDATVQYSQGYQPMEKTWWKKDLTVEDLGIESPYNTYNNPGLPPTAIANPGLASIEAVFKAPENDYLYYIEDKTCKSHFAETFEDHAANISRYLNK